MTHLKRSRKSYSSSKITTATRTHPTERNKVKEVLLMRSLIKQYR